MNSVTLSFQNTQFDIVDLNGQKWLRGLQIASALGYKNPSSDIAKLYERNADEFTPSMTAMVKLPDLHFQTGSADPDLRPQIGDTDTPLDLQTASAGQRREVRIFSLRGAHLLGMLANTESAKEFRRWILDVLENGSNPQLITTVQNHLLANNAKLGLTLLYRQQNLTVDDIAQLLRTTPRRVNHNLSILEVCGLLTCQSPSQQMALL